MEMFLRSAHAVTDDAGKLHLIAVTPDSDATDAGLNEVHVALVLGLDASLIRVVGSAVVYCQLYSPLAAVRAVILYDPW